MARALIRHAVVASLAGTCLVGPAGGTETSAHGSAVDAQAAVIRSLKEGDGLGNADPQVKAAVAELLRLKALLEPVDES